ncbi:hypothetical protein BZA70DRAFT_175340 [Myxozyma melibiosi]|uniref:Nitrogen regulatory protein areA GATA-like domain-containing protein n=1 Tax=Myxozyma melibiosi TaxID=54550 RepID=A0ABR1F5Q5_9ASCO
MPPRFKDPFLSLAPDRIASLDASDEENLFSFWTVFSKCAENLENGRRLENLSWRLWNRDHHSSDPVPDLSSSVDSVASVSAQDHSVPASAKQHHNHSSSLHHPRSDTAERFHRVIESISCDDLDWRKLRALHNQKTSTSTSASSTTATTSIPQPSLTPVAPATQPDSSPVKYTNDGHELSMRYSDAESTDDDDNHSRDSDDHSDDDGRVPRLHRVAPSTTSIVRGFSPSAISVHSVRSELYMSAPRSQPSAAALASAGAAPASGFAARVAARSSGVHTSSTAEPADKKKMFFIESSPSESDGGFGESVSPSTNVGAVAPHNYNLNINNTNSNLSSSLRNSFTAKRPALAPMTPVTGPAKSVSLGGNGSSSSSSSNAHAALAKKKASFKEEIITIPSSGEIEEDEDDEDDEDDMDDDDDDDISESAIDDADSDWDSVEDEGPSSFDESTFFVRERSLPTVPSRRSLLSSLLGGDEDRHQHLLSTRSSPALAMSNTRQQQQQQQQQQRRVSALATGIAAANTSAIEEESAATSASSTESAGSPSRDSRNNAAVPVPTAAARKASNGVPSSHATVPAMPTLSPRSTRRNMLATELSESLRRNLLWERQQKTVATAAVLKRRHTSHDVSHLTTFPEPTGSARAGASGRRDAGPSMTSQTVTEGQHASFEEEREFDHTEFGYHARGW